MYRTANGNPCEAKPGSPVKLGDVPKWLAARLLQAFGPDPCGYRDGRSLFEHWARVHGGTIPWIDHWGSTVVVGRQLLVSEPYLQTSNDFSKVRRFAGMVDCDLVISETSHWFPGKTLRLAFVPLSDCPS